MLIYHAAYDINHGIFRMLRLLENSPERNLKWDTFRILDLYYLFPHLIGKARLPRNLLRKKNMFKKQNTQYNNIPTPKIFIQQTQGLHEIIARSLIGKGFLDASAFEHKLLQRTSQHLPDILLQSFAEATDDQSLVEFLAIDLAAIPLLGTQGLKERTGLLEHRYDAV